MRDIDPKSYLAGLQDARAIVQALSRGKHHSDFAIAIAKQEQKTILTMEQENVCTRNKNQRASH
jgi:hypothetical protein